jgi:hypothetical protein
MIKTPTPINHGQDRKNSPKKFQVSKLSPTPDNLKKATIASKRNIYPSQLEND